MAMKFYTKEQFTAYAKQQIIENKDLICAWHLTRESVMDFDKKVINKRLEDHVNNKLKSEFKHAWFTFERSGNHYYFQIHVRDNDTYPAENGMSVNYVNYQTSAYVNIDDDKRIDAEIVIENINHAMDYLIETNKTLLKEIETINEIEAEFDKIKSMIKDFDNDKSRYIKGLYSFN